MAREGSEFSFNYSLLLHELQMVDNQFVLFMESYYPDYRTVSDITYDYWGRPIPQSYTVFEGYKYISTMVAGFNRNGELMWDNSMEMYNLNTYELQKKVNMFTDSTDIVVYYNEGGRLTFKAFDKDISLTGLVHTQLDPYYRGDNIQETGYEGAVHWYDDNFLCHGYQRIRNTSLIEQSRRTIFYISKVGFN
jgi:hypothetical protein